MDDPRQQLRSIEDDEAKLRPALEHKRRAAELLAHPMLVAAFEAVEADALGAFKKCAAEPGPEGDHNRKAAGMLLKAVSLVKSNVEQHVRNGTIAETKFGDLRRRRTFLEKLLHRNAEEDRERGYG